MGRFSAEHPCIRIPMKPARVLIAVANLGVYLYLYCLTNHRVRLHRDALRESICERINTIDGVWKPCDQDFLALFHWACRYCRACAVDSVGSFSPCGQVVPQSCPLEQDHGTRQRPPEFRLKTS